MCKAAVFEDGIVVHADSTSRDTIDACIKMSKTMFGDRHHTIVTDPPYGNIIDVSWDRREGPDTLHAEWMFEWTRMWSAILPTGGAMYVWGAVGKPGYRPFMKYIPMVEERTDLQCHNVITWGKRRAYGLPHNYLFTREDLAYFVKGPDPRKPRVFNVPYLETLRGYAGFDKDHPAKSPFYRRSNVWTDVNEIFAGKLHPAQKPQRVCEIPIEVSSLPGDVIVDPFAGSGTTGIAARKLGRLFCLVESDEAEWSKILSLLGMHEVIEWRV